MARSPQLHLAFLGLFISTALVSLSRPSLQDYPPTGTRLVKAYIALQAWKHAITDDPKNITVNWCGPNVCSYTGVFCAPAPDNPHEITVAGIDINHGNVGGTLPEELGLLSDLALFHVNSNRFRGGIPETFEEMKLLYELDVSNNRFKGPFPDVVLSIHSLRYLDIRYNHFKGKVPSKLFDHKFDAIFLNHNKFRFSLPENIGNSPVSVIVLANIQITGCLPRSLSKMANTLNEIIIMNTGIRSCLPPDMGMLKNLRVLDVSLNKLVGPLPEAFSRLEKVEQLDVAHNQLSAEIPESICELKRLINFTYSYNYFEGELPKSCLEIKRYDDRKNCFEKRPLQRPEKQCLAVESKPVHCSAYGCLPPSPPPPSPPPPSPPPYLSPPPPPPPPPQYY